MKKTLRIMSILLACLMTLSALPVFAAEDCSAFHIDCQPCPECGACHHYSPDCADFCYRCGATGLPVTAEHQYEYPCSTRCSVCDGYRHVSCEIITAPCLGGTCIYCGNAVAPTDEHQYDHNYDTTCNACGDVRDVTLPIRFRGNSISEDVNGLAFLYDIDVEGMQVNRTAAIFDTATVGGYQLVGMGVIASNHGRLPSIDTVENVRVLDVPAVYLYDLEDGMATYAVRFINIPDTGKNNVITSIPYFIIEVDGVQYTVYGESMATTYNKEANINNGGNVPDDDIPGDGTLSGKVCDASDYSPMANVTIDAYQNDVLCGTTRTDENGNYSISLPAGSYMISASAPGYIGIRVHAVSESDVTTYMETLYMVKETINDGGNDDGEGDEEGDDIVTDGIASGMVTNSLTGDGAPDILLSILPDWGNHSETAAAIATTTTDDDGFYSIELPFGNYTIRASAEGYMTSFFNIIVKEGVTDHQNGTITPIVEEELGDHYLITLTWGENPRDLDSHVEGTLSNGDPFHVVYYEMSAYDINGELICQLDYDDVDSYGPEHITLYTNTDEPYYYYIHRYAGSGAIVTSGAKITIEQNNVLLREFHVPTNLGYDDYWNVFAIKDGRIIICNTITETPNTSYAD